MSKVTRLRQVDGSPEAAAAADVVRGAGEGANLARQQRRGASQGHTARRVWGWGHISLLG